MADDLNLDVDHPSVQARTMAAVDAALEPAERLASTPQPMNTANLRTVITAFRQALATVVYGPPESTTEPTRLEDPVADAAASLVPGKAEPQFPASSDEPKAEAESVFE